MWRSHSRILAVFALGMAIWPGVAAAAASGGSGQASQDGKIEHVMSPSLTGSLVWVIVSLAIVITLIVLLIKWLSVRNRAWGVNRSMRSLGGIALGQNNSLQVIEIAGKVYIVGVGENITLIDKLDDAEEARSVIAALERQSDAGWPMNLLGKLKKRDAQQQSEPSNERWNQGASFQSMLQSKLNQQADRKQQIETLLQDSKTNERLMDDE
jgi:flagellar protein FliO/FliZ